MPKHISRHKDLNREIDWLLSLPGVTKVALGVFSNCRHRKPLRTIWHVRDTSSGFHGRGYVGEGLQEVYVYIEPVSVRQNVLNKMRERYRR